MQTNALHPTAPVDTPRTSSNPVPRPAAGQSTPFATVLGTVAPTEQGASAVVKPGDTLIGMVKRHYREQGKTLSDIEAFQVAQRVARENGMRNPNLMHPGQVIRFNGLGTPAPATANGDSPAATPTVPIVAKAAPAAVSQPVLARPAASSPTPGHGHTGHTPTLDQTLERATRKGYLTPAEVAPVRQRILDMARQYGFSPDDFARVTLMESDGLNPQASNGRCFGIIQFCGGKGRGAASVGFAGNASDIAELSVLDQLDLVDRYFRDTGLHRQGKPVRLDDLYLTVLMPSARTVKQTSVPLNIPGRQAQVLYQSVDDSQMITRGSIVRGLHRQASQLLADMPPAVAQAGAPAQAASAVETVAQRERSGNGLPLKVAYRVP